MVVTLALGVLSGCGYKSDYKPPNDGRARGVWDDDKLVITMPATLPRCKHRIPGEIRRTYSYYVPQDREGYYVPPRRRRSTTIIIVGAPVGRRGFVPAPLLLPGGSLDGDGAKALFVAMGVGAVIAFPFVLDTPSPEHRTRPNLCPGPGSLARVLRGCSEITECPCEEISGILLRFMLVVVVLVLGVLQR